MVYSTCAPGPERLRPAGVTAVGDAHVADRGVQDRDAGALVVHQEVVPWQNHARVIVAQLSGRRGVRTSVAWVRVGTRTAGPDSAAGAD